MSKIAGMTAASLAGDLLSNVLNYSPARDTSISVNGNEIAKTKTSSNNISANYNQSEIEKDLLDYTNQELLSGLKNINVFSDDHREDFQKQIDAYTKQGIKTLNDTYTPIYRNLKADIASRFGNLDNSIFMDKLNDIEKNKTDALETLTENILAKQNELYETEMNNRYNYLDRLTETNQNLNDTILNYLKLAISNSK